MAGQLFFGNIRLEPTGRKIVRIAQLRPPTDRASVQLLFSFASIRDSIAVTIGSEARRCSSHTVTC
jgi:hypothetical protein